MIESEKARMVDAKAIRLDEACRMTLLSVIDKFRSKGRELHPYTTGFASDLGIKI